jgi:hypothetical protein
MTGTAEGDLRSLLVRVISDTSSLDLLADAGDLLARDARFNLWVGTEVKPRGGEQMLKLLDGYEDLLDQCRAALSQAIADRDERACQDAMRIATEQLGRLRDTYR